MPISVQNCPLCGSTRSRPFDQRLFREILVTNRICADCGLVYQSPRMPEDELIRFYEHEYRQLYQGREGPDPKDILVQRGRARSLLDFSRGRLLGLGRHLDIGCSAGLLLQSFQKAYGCEPVGIEPGLAYRTYAQKQGLKVYASLDELRLAGEPPFDLISMAHVLEHLPDPAAYLADLRKTLLAPGGWLLVEVPNLYGHDSFEVAHLISFSSHTLAQAIQKAGFETFVTRHHGQPRSKLIPLYITVLARPAPNGSKPVLTPEHAVKLKRQWGMLRRRFLTGLFPDKAWLALDYQGPAN